MIDTTNYATQFAVNSTTTETIDYATQFGFHSIIPAFVFLGAYGLFLIFFTTQFIRWRSCFYLAILTFCAVRVTAFSIRGYVLLHKDSAGQNLSLMGAFFILAKVGMFLLIFAFLALLSDLLSINDLPGRRDYICSRGFWFFALVLCINLCAVGIGLAPTYVYDVKSAPRRTRDLEWWCNAFYFIAVFTSLPGVLLFPIARLSPASRKALMEEDGRHINPGPLHRMPRPSRDPEASMQDSIHLGKHIEAILFVIWTFFCICMSYAIWTEGSPRHVDEKLWYPLAGSSEVIILALFMIPRVVPNDNKY